ncbi:hypothetical protein KEM52_003016 [Ascosphaera acerosa]|nr:hypothetical protein KEM52_003016 [Ascosphaera acerosa]
MSTRARLEDIVVPCRVDGEPAGVQLLDTTKRIARKIIRESWRSTEVPGAINYRDHKRNVASQTCANAILAHLKAEEKPKGWGCARCENKGDLFTSCRASDVWAPNGACTGCLHGGKGKDCSFARERECRLRARRERDLLEGVKDRRADEVACLATQFVFRNRPRQPFDGMTAEEAKEIAKEAEDWVRYVKLISEMQQDAELLSPARR